MHARMQGLVRTHRSSIGVFARRRPVPSVVRRHTSNHYGPTAVMFMNMGGPIDQNEVAPFLRNLFSDDDLIPFGSFQPYVAEFITRMRTSKIKKQYAAIGGGSPIRRWSELQAREACKILDRISPSSAPHLPYVAFRYAKPLTEDVYAQLLADGFGTRGRVVAFSQYPQHSCGTSGSSVNRLAKCRQMFEPTNANDAASGSGIKWSVIDRWPTHPKFIEAVAHNIEVALATFPEAKRQDVTILFSAHSQPISMAQQGDAYSVEVAASVHATMEHLRFSNPYRLCWQSKVGPQTWLGPQTSRVVQSYVDKGDPQLLLVPISFTSDHIETLYELDEELIAEHKHDGNIKRAASLNDSPIFLEALAEIAKEHIASGYKASRQFSGRCFGCTKASCEIGRTMSN